MWGLRTRGYRLGDVAMVAWFAAALLLIVWLKGCPSGPAPVPATTREVTVVRGDSLWRLSECRRDGYDPRAWVEATCRLNGWRDVPMLQPGQRIRVPDWRLR